MISGTTRIDGRRYNRTDPMPENSPAGKRNRQRIRADSLCQSRMPSFLFDERFQYGQFAVSCPHFLVEFMSSVLTPSMLVEIPPWAALLSDLTPSIFLSSLHHIAPVAARIATTSQSSIVPVPSCADCAEAGTELNSRTTTSTSTTLNRVFLFPVPSCSRSAVYRFSFRIGKPPRPQRRAA